MSRNELEQTIIRIIYKFDLIIVRIRRTIKHVLPTKFTNWIQEVRGKSENPMVVLLDDVNPWMSPNIWSEIVDFYRMLADPVVLEFGTGSSTIKHFEEMLTLKNASYIGIENDPTWFWVVVVSILRKAHLTGRHVSIQMKYLAENTQDKVDVEILCENVNFLLRLRVSVNEYISALDMKCNVIIIDGISRKMCVHKVLNSTYLCSGGLLMLMEAGRGAKHWWEGRLEGSSDYSAEVATLLSLGGKILDGNGLDHWPSCKKRSPRPVSYYYPMEACKLILP